MSFVKIKKENSVEIAGLRTSIRNGLVCSSGSDSFDFVLGGGFELNSVILIGEDKYRKYSNIISKLFLADAFHHNHQIYYANLDEDPKKIMKDIPMPIENSSAVKEEKKSEDNDLRIAFRYQALPKLDSVRTGANSNQINYDLTKKYDQERIVNASNVKYFSFQDYQQRKGENDSTSALNFIIEDLHNLVQQAGESNLIRVCINSLGSPVWYSENFSAKLLEFLVKLKSFTRFNNVICFLTMPLHLISLMDDQLIFKIRKLVDVNVNLQSFDNVEKQTNAVFKQYHGLLHIKKLQTITALQSHKPETFDLAFKLKLHKFVIEKLHLPPELQESESSSNMSCSSGNKSLDF